MAAFDYKKEYKDLYLPGKKPKLVTVPKMCFFQVKGRGNPNTSASYQAAMEILYGLSYTIKMSKMGGTEPEGYFDYVVPPLEGLWWYEDESFDGLKLADKDKFCWISMIRQPEFVTEKVFLWAKELLAKKKPNLDFSDTTYVEWEEGVCAQIMHFGPYDDEPATIKILKEFVEMQGYQEDLGSERPHHEIYLSDPRRTDPTKMKTVIRHPVLSIR